MPSLGRKGRNLIRRTASNALSKGKKLTEILANSFPERTPTLTCDSSTEPKGQKCPLHGLDNLPTSISLTHSSCNKNYQKNAFDTFLEDSPYFFELLEKLQGDGRFNDQRCILSDSPTTKNELVDDVFTDTNYFLPKTAGYWVEDIKNSRESGHVRQNNQEIEFTSEVDLKSDKDEIALVYRKFFLGQEHYNYSGVSQRLGPILISAKNENVSGKDNWRIIFRHKTVTLHQLLQSSEISENTINAEQISQIVKLLEDDLSENVLFTLIGSDPQISNLILAYDEHNITSTYKFGVLCQRKGQLTEEELFSNQSSKWMDTFLENLGSHIQLKGHDGYRGGLDTIHGQTGEISVYDIFQSQEIMFHVSSYLPFSESDPQQLEKKRHIGNDIVAVIFQESDSRFAPDMIVSNFLHAFIIVKVLDPEGPNRRYQVGITAREDVPFFGPALPEPPIFRDGPDFHQFLITKLINAEKACYRAASFSKLELRTRKSLLQTLVEEIQIKSNDSQREATLPEICVLTPSEFYQNRDKKITKENRLRFAETIQNRLTPVRNMNPYDRGSCSKILFQNNISSFHLHDCIPLLQNTPIKKARRNIPQKVANVSNNYDGPLGSNGPIVDSRNLFVGTELENQLTRIICENDNEQQSASCLTRSGSFLNTSTRHLNFDIEKSGSEAFRIELNRLKYEKLDLLQLNLQLQKELNKLRLRDSQLHVELSLATKEISRLRNRLGFYV